MRKLLLALVLGLALALYPVVAPAGSWTYVGSDLYGGVGVYSLGADSGSVSGYGEVIGSTTSDTGETYMECCSSLDGAVEVDGGFAMAGGYAYGDGYASEWSGGAYADAWAGSGSYSYCAGNASANMSSWSGAWADALNY